MKKGFILMALILISIGIKSQPSRQWTLNECIQYALENNITLKKSKLAKQSATEGLKQAKADLLPNISLSTNQSVGYRPWTDMGISTVTNGTVATSVKKTYYNGSYGLNLNWTVWNGNRNINNIKLNRITEEQAELDTETNSNIIQEEIAKLYIQILYMKEAIIVANQSYAVSVKNEERGRELMEVGKMSKADLAQLTAQRASDKYTLVNAESNLANYKLQLKQLLELTGNDDFDIHTPEISDEDALTDIPQLQSIYESALVLRPEIRKSILSIEAGNTNLSIAKAGYMPTISITGGGGTSSTSMTSKNWGTQLKTNFDASVGATISIPISDNRKTKTAISKAKIEQVESMLDLEDKKKQIYYAIDSYWLDATTNQQKFIAAIDDVRSEEASYELLSEQFELGMKNIIELMSGKTNLINARYNKLQSKYMAILNIQLLNFYKGDKIDI